MTLKGNRTEITTKNYLKKKLLKKLLKKLIP